MAASSKQGVQGGRQKSEYHHFIPRFILRNYASAIPAPSGTSKRKKKQRAQLAKDGMLNVIDLAGVKVTQAPLSRSFGLLDMYRDVNSFDEFELENKLSKLESEAAKIMNRIRKRFESGFPDVWLKRAERDTLRKFLFIMKYRSQTFYQRFNTETGEYIADDKEDMLKYMEEKGFKRPVDVWFHNIHAFIDLNMDAEKKWIHEICTRAYPGDAMWFFIHIQGSYLKFCQTSNPNEEFLLTGNAYSIFEGPNTATIDPSTGLVKLLAYTEYHCFAPLTPSLMIVLRSNLLPLKVQEGTDDFSERLVKTHKIIHGDTPSILQDLPVDKCGNSYSKIENGMVVAIDGPALPASEHSFCFKFFPTPSAYVKTINYILLAEATDKIVFKSKTAACSIIESFLMDDHPAKVVTDLPSDTCASYLKNLETIVQQLGDSARSNHKVKLLLQNDDALLGIMGRKLEQLILDAPPAADTSFLTIYKTLGGEVKDLPKDTDQAKRMFNLVTKVDVAIKHLPQATKSEIQLHRQELLLTLPTRRVWLLLKAMRNIMRPDKAQGDGAEDVIANVSQLFRPNTLTRAMYLASRTEDLLATNPEMGLVKKLTLDAEGMQRFQEEKYLVFERAGIPQIESLASSLYAEAKRLKVYENSEISSKLLSAEELLELATRNAVEESFLETLASDVGDMEDRLLTELKEVMFGLLYIPEIGARSVVAVMDFTKAQLAKIPPVALAILSNSTVFITGADAGLGIDVAREFLPSTPKRLILAVCDVHKGNAAKHELE
ncbi:hypothetical protein MMC30_004190 [Trapelia coarctata]|nr:hypothetical protein [Trapelia coarctata]